MEIRAVKTENCKFCTSKNPLNSFASFLGKTNLFYRRGICIFEEVSCPACKIIVERYLNSDFSVFCGFNLCTTLLRAVDEHSTCLMLTNLTSIASTKPLNYNYLFSVIR